MDISTREGCQKAMREHCRFVREYMMLLGRFRKLPACEDLVYSRLIWICITVGQMFMEPRNPHQPHGRTPGRPAKMTKKEEAPRTTPADGMQAAAALADGATLHVAGAWTLGNPHPDATEFLAENPMQGEWTLECGGLKRWDTTLLVFLSKVYAEAEARGFALKEGDLPRGLSRLLQMCRASRNATSAAANAAPPRKTLLQCFGVFGVELKETILEILLFTGELTVSIGRLLGWRTQMRWCDFRHQLTECGPKALPIISLISFLMGLVLAFVGSIPLKWFQAQQYVASLVGIGMFRLMAPVMVGIVMAGADEVCEEIQQRKHQGHGEESWQDQEVRLEDSEGFECV